MAPSKWIPIFSWPLQYYFSVVFKPVVISFMCYFNEHKQRSNIGQRISWEIQTHPLSLYMECRFILKELSLLNVLGTCESL